ncbi:flavin reductase family protein [Pelomonas sp. KK5]|uniref:flavin reductase family protein n=1 Tax=Pelomonas sp. KK5 TaxID=1855730 RepID=UPI00097BED83|nr:flavin reductase family protein [Pelomonas sp. KK5]
MDKKLFRDVMGHFATGVTVVGYVHEGEARGMTANAFMSVSLDPPLAMVSVRRAARFAAAVPPGGRFGVSFLLESQQELSSHFGGRPIEGIADPFETRDGAPLVAGALAQMVLRTVDIHPAGDHLLYIGEIEHLALGRERKPLVFYSGAYKQVDMKTAPPEICWSGSEGW